MMQPAINLKSLLKTGLIASLLYCNFACAADDEKSNAAAELKIPPLEHSQIIDLKDGSTLIGRIIEISDGEILFNSELGKIKIPLQSIKKIREVPDSSIRKGQYWFPNPNSTRLYVGPTARMLKKGEGYFSDIELFFPSVTFGLTDRVTLGGGMSIFPGIGLDEQLFFLTPKVSIKSYENVHFATGALLLKIPDVSPTVGIIYGLGTVGTPDGSITAGLGYGFVGRHTADKPMVMIGGEKRLTRRLAFVSENWIIPGADAPVVSYGIRLMGEGLCVDLAFFNPLNKDAIFPGIPYLDLAYKF